MTANRACIAPTFVAVTLATLLGLSGAVLAQSAETSADATGGEGRTGTLALTGMSYNDGSTWVLPGARAH